MHFLQIGVFIIYLLQPPSQMSSSQNGINSFSSARKYSPVAPPTAPKPNFVSFTSKHEWDYNSYLIGRFLTIEQS